MMFCIVKRDPARCSGGVPRHTQQLKTVFPQMQIISLDMLPVKSKLPQDQAVELSERIKCLGLINDDDVVITDGYWACGIPNKDRIISICHGTIAGVTRNTKHPGAIAQRSAMQGTKVVSVSANAANECLRFYGLNSEIILNAVNLDIFKPATSRGKAVGVIDGQGKKTSFQPIIDSLADVFDVRLIKGDWPHDIVRGLQGCGAFLHLSDYEGCSYAVLEALACGIPVIGTNVGMLATDIERAYGFKIGEIVRKEDDFRSVVLAVTKVLEFPEKYNSREFCLRWCGPEAFARQWHEVVNSIGKGY